MRKNWLTTVAGVMVSVGGFPLALSTLGYPINHTVAVVMVITGLFGGALLGASSKGQDEHSTVSQTIEASEKQITKAIDKEVKP